MSQAPHTANPLLVSAARFLADRDRTRMRRRLATSHDVPIKDLATNDYLGLSRHPEVVAAAQEALARHGAGASASPLLSCRHTLNEQLSDTMSRVLPQGWGCVFVSSGYAANAVFFDTLQLLGTSLELFIDHRSHASIISGARSSGLRSYFFPHRDYDRLAHALARSKAEMRVIVVESLHSMDGDFEPFDQLAHLCQMHPGTYVYIDEAHSAGTFGQPSWILSTELCSGIAPFVTGLMLGCGKTLGASGGILCLPESLREAALQGARPLVYSTAPPPATLAAVNAALRVILRDGPSLARSLQSLMTRFTTQLDLLQVTRNSQDRDPGQITIGVSFAGSRPGPERLMSPIVTLKPAESSDRIGSLFTLREALLGGGFAAPVIRTPTVPSGHECIRMSFALDAEAAASTAGCNHDQWPEKLALLVRSASNEAKGTDQ